ncbi:hypothetical protein MG293_012430 [Ovis ammon polii]|uniref:Uncharacterized protein n=1 Tax=Ovis ammon polii TaxID=230172 RepID=A0AAD4Y7S3_OVIAM|nr:hypothetical protein MG293_012430 [Ovis ammon polii]
MKKGVPVLSARLSYCAENTIKNCICTNLSVSKLSCDDITFNRLYQFVAGWTLLGSDLILIILSYSFILKAVLRIKAEGAAAKALSTCGSHFILILFFSTVLLVLVITNLARKRIPPDVPILLNILHHLIPPALNPIVYARAAIFVVARNGLLTMPVPILSSRLRYCAENTIKNCICTNLSVSKLSCDDITFNRLYRFVAGWTLLGSDLILIILSYSCILKAVLKIKVEGAAAKALSTCGSHFILILFFSTVLLVLVITNLARKRIPPDVPILLNILHHLIPPALNPIVYGVRTKEIKQGIQKLLRRL